MIVKLLTEHHLEFLSLKGICRGSSESTLVKMPHCWKSHALAHILISKKCSNRENTGTPPPPPPPSLVRGVNFNQEVALNLTKSVSYKLQS